MSQKSHNKHMQHQVINASFSSIDNKGTCNNIRTMRMSTMMKRKDIVDNGGVRPKAVWDMKTVELYIKLCLGEVEKGEHNGTNLTEKGDNVENAIDVLDEWWEKKQLENPRYGKFRRKGLRFYNELTALFKDTYASSSFCA
ncbi:hypothetical protein P8452_12733 [Trifolium repens]|nr:hypothetical protein P8452_12733 [Trifolium repens]